MRSELVPRFSATARALHWIHATGFLAMTSTGLALYVPAWSGLAGGRTALKAVHLAAAALWFAGIAATVALADRRALRSALHDLEHFDVDDRRWFRNRQVPQGRFNAGQKLHTALQAGLACLLGLSGTLLWLGERNHALRTDGALTLHDAAGTAGLVLLSGHLWFAVIQPSTRPALRGIVTGRVSRDWASHHHPKWDPRHETRPPTAPGQRLVALASLALGAGVALLFLREGDLLPL